MPAVCAGPADSGHRLVHSSGRLGGDPVRAAVNPVKRNARRSSGGCSARRSAALPGQSLPRPPAQAPGQAARGPGSGPCRGQIRELGYQGSSNLLVRYLKQSPHGGEPPAPVPRRAARSCSPGPPASRRFRSAPQRRPEEINTKTKMIGRHMHGRVASPRATGSSSYEATIRHHRTRDRAGPLTNPSPALSTVIRHLKTKMAG